MGFVVGILVSLLVTRLGAGVIVAMLYCCVLGALVGRLSALRVHRWVRPRHKLQPIRNEVVRRRMILALVVWGALPLVLVIAFAVFGGPGRIEIAGRRLLGELWALLAGD